MNKYNEGNRIKGNLLALQDAGKITTKPTLYDFHNQYWIIKTHQCMYTERLENFCKFSYLRELHPERANDKPGPQ